jgi:hypothetical protein
VRKAAAAIRFQTGDMTVPSRIEWAVSLTPVADAEVLNQV